MKKGLLLLLLSVMVVLSLYAQEDYTDTYNQNQATTKAKEGSEITLQRNVNFQTALKILEQLALAEERKNIMNLSSYDGGIPFQINNLPWREALRLITSSLGLLVDEKPGAIIISDIPADVSQKTAATDYNIHDKMILITATFLSLDRKFVNQAGIDWNTLFRGQVNANVGMFSGENIPDTGMNVNSPSPTGNIMGPLSSPHGNPTALHTWPIGAAPKTWVSLDAILRFVETNNKGEILARPTARVVNGKKTNLQVGSDVSFVMTNEQGTTERTYNTGIILDVTPTILEEGGQEVIYLQASVQKSEVVGYDQKIAGTTINKNQASTDVILYNGEETIIGGLIDTQTDRSRGGIPYLNRLPWWLGGFLFRYSSSTTINREMVVIIKAEIIPPALERAKQANSVRDDLDYIRNEFKDVEKELLMSDSEREKQKDDEAQSEEEVED